MPERKKTIHIRNPRPKNKSERYDYVKTRFTKDFLNKSPFTKNQKVKSGPLDVYLIPKHSVDDSDFDDDNRGVVDG